MITIARPKNCGTCGAQNIVEIFKVLLKAILNSHGQTWQEIEANQTHLGEIIMKINGKTSLSKWAGSDLNQRTPPCQGGILTKLDHRPLIQLV
jgi:hypothetical protein